MITSRTSKDWYVVCFDTGYTHRCKTLRQAAIFAHGAPDEYGKATKICRYLKTTTIDKCEVDLEGVSE